jgi:hypothetical protein
MLTVASTTPAPPVTTTATPTPEQAGGGVQGVIGDLLRSSAAGYQASARTSAVQADKAAIHPFEAVTTATGLVKQKTANVPVVSRATGMLHTIGGFAMLIMTANVSSTLRSPGDTAVDLGNRVADLIDGRSTIDGWSLGWGLRTPGSGEGDEDGGDQVSLPVATSALGAALAGAGMK